MHFHSYCKAFSQIFNKCSNIFWNFYNISCLRFGYLNSDRWLEIHFKKAAIWFLIDCSLCNIWNRYWISSFITRNNYFHKIFRCSALTIYCYWKFHYIRNQLVLLDILHFQFLLPLLHQQRWYYGQPVDLDWTIYASISPGSMRYPQMQHPPTQRIYLINIGSDSQ